MFSSEQQLLIFKWYIRISAQRQYCWLWLTALSTETICLYECPSFQFKYLARSTRVYEERAYKPPIYVSIYTFLSTVVISLNTIDLSFSAYIFYLLNLGTVVKLWVQLDWFRSLFFLRPFPNGCPIVWFEINCLISRTIKTSFWAVLLVAPLLQVAPKGP